MKSHRVKGQNGGEKTGANKGECVVGETVKWDESGDWPQHAGMIGPAPSQSFPMFSRKCGFDVCMVIFICVCPIYVIHFMVVLHLLHAVLCIKLMKRSSQMRLRSGRKTCPDTGQNQPAMCT